VCAASIVDLHGYCDYCIQALPQIPNMPGPPVLCIPWFNMHSLVVKPVYVHTP